MTKRKNIIAVVVIGLIKAAWYVVKGIAQIIWFIWTSLAKGVAWILRTGKHKKAATPTPIGTTDETAETVPEPEHGAKKHTAVNTPLVAKKVKTGDFNDFSKRLASASIIALIAGKRGSGKSTLGFRIMENAHASMKRPCYVLGVKADVLPDWITSITDVEQVANGGIVLVDEGALTYSSRDSMNKKNKELGKLLAIARHKDLTLLLITQNTGMIDKNVLNLCDTVMLKEGSLLQQSMEREAMKDLYAKADKALEELPKEQRVSHTYIVDNDFEGLVRFTMPSFWSSAISKNRA